MKRLLSTLAGVTLAVAAVAPMAVAQDAAATRAVRFGVQGGISMPTGDAGDGLDMGYLIGGTLDWRITNVPVGIRFGVNYTSWGASEGEGDLHSLFGTGSAVVAVPTSGGVRPYVLGGVGLYNTSCDGCDGSTDMGLHVGGGLNFALGTMDTFVEATYHTVFTDGESNLNFIPVVFGIRF